MKLTKQQIKHIASLARLELTNKELDLYGKQLSGILKYIDQLQDVDVTDVEPTAQVTGLSNVLREDKIKDWDESEREEALGEAPDRVGRFIKVKRVLE
jgi:aspartyl-tRNA(Asn)/glutamyl-tRNA(Gln) amidotransferase subunit C